MIGYTRAELEPLTYAGFHALVHPSDFPQLENVLKGKIAGDTTNFEHYFRMQHKNGCWVWIRARGEVLKRGTQKALLLGGIHINVTELKSETELERRTAQKLDTILTASPAVSYQISAAPPYAVQYLAPNLEAVTGIKRSNLENEGGWHQLVHNSDLQRVDREFSQWLACTARSR